MRDERESMCAMRRRAEQCRRWAAQCRNPDVAAVLLELADEFDQAGERTPSECRDEDPAK
jgi:hypothetical protein